MDYISASQVNTFLRCPMQYFYSYIKGIKNPPTGALTLGGSFHHTAEHNFRQKKDKKKDLKLTVLQDVFNDTFKERAKETDWKEDDPDKTKETGLSLVETYRNDYAPAVQPFLIEQKINVSLPDLELSLLVIIDLVDDTMMIRDLKTASKTPAEDEIKKSIQLALYAAAFRAATQSKESGIGLDYFIKTKVPKCVSLKEIITDDRIARALNTASKIIKIINLGIFYPKTDGWQCSEKWCGYYKICEGR